GPERRVERARRLEPGPEELHISIRGPAGWGVGQRPDDDDPTVRRERESRPGDEAGGGRPGNYRRRCAVAGRPKGQVGDERRRESLELERLVVRRRPDQEDPAGAVEREGIGPRRDGDEPLAPHAGVERARR